MKRMIFGLLALITAGLLLMGCPGPTYDPIRADSTITHFDIPEVVVPVIGGTPVSGVTSDQYTGTVSWSPLVSGTFAAATVYTADITLTPKSGYTLSGIAANSFTVDGATSVTHSVGSGVVTAVFPPTAATITLFEIPGITAPEAGASPVSSLDASQYTGTVSWSPEVSGTFAAATVYTAAITLTPKSGYTLSGVPANSFTVDDATSVTYSAGSGVVSAVYWTLPMVSVPAGTFQRDDTVDNTSIVSAFWMSAYEITQSQYKAIMSDDPSDISMSSGIGDPVQMTNWYHAIAFCNKLSLAEGLSPVYTVAGVDFEELSFGQIPMGDDTVWNEATATWTNNGYRLPTEMEWMWAAMGADIDDPGSINTTGYAKAFAGSDGSNAIGDYAWYGFNGCSSSQPVGTKKGNELGLFDMSGNVWEWCWDWYAGYPPGEKTNYRGGASGTKRVLRGGSWYWGEAFCTVASRYPYNPDLEYPLFGFRVVRP